MAFLETLACRSGHRLQNCQSGRRDEMPESVHAEISNFSPRCVKAQECLSQVESERCTGQWERTGNN